MRKESEKILYSLPQSKALGLYLQQLKIEEIAERVGVTGRSVQSWISKFKWKDLRKDCPPELVMRQRLTFLMWVPEKSDKELRELDMLLRHTFGDPKTKNAKAKDGTNKGRPSNKQKNDVSKIDKKKLDEFREKTFFRYQLDIYKVKQNPKLNWMRFYLKSRQIGLTYFFAYEAFEDAILTGDNQIFLSASKKQSEIFKTYIKGFALTLGEVELKGKDELHLSNGAIIYFLSTNSRTAQGFHGHLYIDEVFWIPNFKILDDLAGGMSIHDKWRTTYLSTPSSIAHDAYPKWRGSKKHKIDISYKTLQKGKLGADGIYRQIITVDDAIKGGANFFNMDKLKLKYPDKDVFDNLLRCKFLDDASSVFELKKLMGCMVNTESWRDVKFDSSRPVGNSAVWLGYDPSGAGDEAAVLVCLPPLGSGSFRLIEKVRLRGNSYEEQAAKIKELCGKYNVAEIAMDVSGIGEPVAQLIEVFFPNITRIVYSVNTKNSMVYKAREVINAGRLLFDSSWSDLVHSLMMIKRTTTQRNQSVTFTAARTKEHSHADIGMALLHLLSLEGINIHQDVTPTVSFTN